MNRQYQQIKSSSVFTKTVATTHIHEMALSQPSTSFFQPKPTYDYYDYGKTNEPEFKKPFNK